MTAEQLRAWRLGIGLTQQDLADELGVCRKTVGDWEGGTTRIRTIHERAMRDLDRVRPGPLHSPAVYWGSPRWSRYHDPDSQEYAGDRARNGS